MILVTVGTHYLPFDRLIKMISAVRDKTLENIVIQSGSSEIRVGGTTQRDYFSFDEIIEHLKKARVVISHAGLATVFQSLSMAGKMPIIVPRRKEYGEHVSNHQVFFAEYLAKSGKAFLIESSEELLSTILNRKLNFKFRVMPRKSPALVKRLEKYLAKQDWGNN